MEIAFLVTGRCFLILPALILIPTHNGKPAFAFPALVICYCYLYMGTAIMTQVVGCVLSFPDDLVERRNGGI